MAERIPEGFHSGQSGRVVSGDEERSFSVGADFPNYSAGSAPPSHNFTVRSHDALASFIPSGERVMLQTAGVWALIDLKQRPFDRSENLIVASSPMDSPRANPAKPMTPFSMKPHQSFRASKSARPRCMSPAAAGRSRRPTRLKLTTRRISSRRASSSSPAKAW